jgi:hypothetical protein
VAHIRPNVAYTCAEEFTVKGSNGYTITVSADPEGPEGSASSVQLTTEGHGGTAIYIVPGKVTPDSIKARFGRLGRVAVHFQPSGHQRRAKLAKKCFINRPPVVSSRLGSFSGTIRFRGELGYTQVSARRAQGGIGDPITNTSKRRSCDFHQTAAQQKRERESVFLEASTAGGKLSLFVGRLFGRPSFQALSRRSPASRKARYMFLVGTGERSGRMRILRLAVAIGGPEDFSFNRGLTSATVEPPAPFTGTGSFLRNPDGSTSWTGSLAVSLPGLGSVPLTTGKAELETVAAHLKQLEEEVGAERE